MPGPCMRSFWKDSVGKTASCKMGWWGAHGGRRVLTWPGKGQWGRRGSRPSKRREHLCKGPGMNQEQDAGY